MSNGLWIAVMPKFGALEVERVTWIPKLMLNLVIPESYSHMNCPKIYSKLASQDSNISQEIAGLFLMLG